MCCAASCAATRDWSGEVATRIAGSARPVRQASGRLPGNSINFITCHDGFTLNDLVSYNDKHNEANGEDNRDGSNDNLSLELRRRGRDERCRGCCAAPAPGEELHGDPVAVARACR